MEKKEKRAKRFHFLPDVNIAQRTVVLDKEMLKKGTCLCSYFEVGDGNRSGNHPFSHISNIYGELPT